MITDPIADFLTRIRNAIKARHDTLAIPASKVKQAMTQVLYDKGYIKSYTLQPDDGPQGTIKVVLKYHPKKKIAAIHTLQRVSKPGLRKYLKAHELPHILNGLGIALISTSKGIMSDKEARKLHLGGEFLCLAH